MFSGQEPTFTGPFNLPPGMLPPEAAMALQMLGPALRDQLPNPWGMLPGQLFPTQSFYDQQIGQRYYRGMQESMAEAAKADTATYTRMIGQVMGRETLREQQTARTMAQDFAKVAPFIAQVAPDLFDQIHGSQGSAIVLAQAMHRLGQHTIDPVTGKMGVTGATSGALATEIFDQNFGPMAGLSRMQGISAGEAGQLYEQLAQRGLAGSSIGQMGRAQQVEALAAMPLDENTLARMAGRTGRTVDEIRGTQQQLKALAGQGGTADLSQLDKMPGIDDMLRTFDAHKVATSMESFKGAVSAMREIFGDSGRSNVPMREVIEGLEQLAQGGLATQSPAQLESLVRSTHVLAKQAGVSLQVLQGLSAGAGELADKYGLDRSYAPYLVKDTLAFGAAVKNSGRLDQAAYGAPSLEEATIHDLKLRASAASSPVANRMNAVLRLVAEKGAPEKDADGDLTELGEFARAIRDHELEYTYGGQKQSVGMTHEQFVDLLGRNGLNRAAAEALTRQQHANAEYGIGTPVPELTRKLQGSDTARIFGNAYQSGISPIANELKLGDDTRAFTQQVARDVAQATVNMPREQQVDTAKRNTVMAQAVQDSVERQARSRAKAMKLDEGAEATRALAALGPAGDDGIRERARLTAMVLWGDADQYFVQRGSTAQKELLAQSPELQVEFDKRQQQVKEEAALSKKLSEDPAVIAAGQAPLRRAADAFLNADKDDPSVKLFRKLLGDVDLGKLSKDPEVKKLLEESGAIPPGGTAKPTAPDDAKDLKKLAKPPLDAVDGPGGSKVRELNVGGTLTIVGLEKAILNSQGMLTGGSLDAPPIAIGRRNIG